MKILLNYTVTQYPNELERQSSIIKPVLLTTNSKGSFHELTSLEHINNLSNGSLNTKYPVPLEPINTTSSNHSLNNASSYIDNSYVPESPKLHTYSSNLKSKGDDILKTRKICVVNTSNNNLMNIIDGHTNTLSSVSTMNQKQRKRSHYIQKRPKLATLPKSYHHLLF